MAKKKLARVPWRDENARLKVTQLLMSVSAETAQAAERALDDGSYDLSALIDSLRLTAVLLERA